MEIINWVCAHREVCGVCLGILVNALALAYNVFKFCRAGRAKKLSDLLALAEAAREYEVEAETMIGYSAAEKLNYVLTRLRIRATELGCAFEEEKMKERVNADIAFSKAVNADKSERLE